MIKQLINPKTGEYRAFKEHVMSNRFTWHWIGSTSPAVPHEDDYPFFGHCFLQRPMNSKVDPYLYPTQTCELLPNVNYLIGQILAVNDIEINCLLRVNVNMTLPQYGPNTLKHTPTHVDHPFPHKNMLIYLNESDGATVAGLDSFDPVEDAIILFEGEHHHYLPTKGRRLVMIVTYV